MTHPIHPGAAARRDRRTAAASPVAALLALAAAGVGSATSAAAADPPPDIGPLKPGRWYAAEPWAREHAEDLETWVKLIVGEGTAEAPVPTQLSQSNRKGVRRMISALALLHAARAHPGDAPEGWRSNAGNNIGQLRQVAESKKNQDTKGEENSEPATSPAGWCLKIAQDEKSIYQPNYQIPILLLGLEHLSAGLLDAGDAGVDSDRDPIGTLRPPADPARRQAIRTLAFRLMQQGKSVKHLTSGLKQPPVEGKFLPGGTADYDDWRTADYQDRRKADADSGVTGNVLMGLLSAVELGVLTDPPSGGANDKGAISAAAFEERLVDLLVHTVLTFSLNRTGSGYVNESSAVFKRETQDTLDGAAADWQVGYRHRREAGPGGVLRREFAVMRLPDRPRGKTTVRRYWSEGASHPYDTASGGYAVLVASRLLSDILRDAAAEGRVELGHQYRLERLPPEDRWTCNVDGTSRPLEFVLSPTFRHTPLRLGGGAIDGGAAGDLAIDTVVDETLNSLLNDLYEQKGKLVGGWSTNTHPAYSLFAIGKFFVAAGLPDAIGPHAWHHDFCGRMKTELGTKNKKAIMPQFAILMATRAYRPLYRMGPSPGGSSRGGTGR